MLMFDAMPRGNTDHNGRVCRTVREPLTNPQRICKLRLAPAALAVCRGCSRLLHQFLVVSVTAQNYSALLHDLLT